MDVVALARRDRVSLAAVLDEPAPDRIPGGVVVEAEDGRRFPISPSAVLVRLSGLGAPDAGEEVTAWLARLREAAAEPPAWESLHRRVREGARLGVGDLAAAVGVEGSRAVLDLALAVERCEPWFHRAGPRLVRAAREVAESELARVEAQRRCAREDAALLAWWADRAQSPAPDDARGALEALAQFALRGDHPQTERGKALAGRLDMPDPDRALEAVVGCGGLARDVNPAPLRAGLAEPFPEDVLAQADRLAAEPGGTAGREDLTDLFTVAIDDRGTREVDDAISLRTGPAGPELLVHIADVAGAVAKDSALDRIGAQRGTSMYLPEVSIPMLPIGLVTGRLSLDEGRERDALTAVFPLAPDGTAGPPRFVRSRVRVDRQLTYGEALDPAALASDAATGRELLALGDSLEKERTCKGAMVLSLESLSISARGGAPRIGTRPADQRSNRLVTECMVLVNAAAGDLLSRAGVPALFRSQGPPRGPLPPPDDPLREINSRRVLSPAQVCMPAARHHGLGLDAYAQTTSPIRRYGDLVNQRQLLAVLDGSVPPHTEPELVALLGHLLERERDVRRATDLREGYWLARLHEPLVGQTVEGRLTRPPKRGMAGVWVPSLCRELPLRVPRDWAPTPVGFLTSWRIARVLPYRGRIELSPA